MIDADTHVFTNRVEERSMPVSRRSVLGRLAAFLSVLLAPSARTEEQIDVKASPVQIEAWMDEWMSSSKFPSGGLFVGRFADPIYYLLKPITWTPNHDQADKFKSVTAPEGFVTDFASIPRVFWSLLRPDGLYAYAAVIHDYLYWQQTIDRESSDNILGFAMEDFGVDFVTRTAIHRAVSLFGRAAWDENQNLKKSGESRFLKSYPDDPRITWSQWRRDRRHFT